MRLNVEIVVSESMDGEILVAYGWYTSLPDQLADDLALHFDASYIYMFRGFTDPRYRGRRLHALGMACAARAFAEEGYVGLISYVEATNSASLRSTARLGFRIFGTIAVAKCLGRLCIVHSRGCREFGFVLRPN